MVNIQGEIENNDLKLPDKVILDKNGFNSEYDVYSISRKNSFIKFTLFVRFIQLTILMRSKRTKPANTSLNILKLNYNTFPMKGMSDF